MLSVQFASSQSSRCLADLCLFVRWDDVTFATVAQMIDKLLQDREAESRFGITPVPGKIGAAMASAGMTSGRPPPPSAGFNNHGPGGGGGGGGGGGNPGNQLYVGNVGCSIVSSQRSHRLVNSCHIRLAGRISRTCSGHQGISCGLTSTSAQMAEARAQAPSSSRRSRMLKTPSVSSICN
jgi:hypothetical protein